MLLMELVSLSTEEGGIHAVLAEKDKRKLPFPVSTACDYRLNPVQFYPLQSEQALLHPHAQLLGDAVCGYPPADIHRGGHHRVLQRGMSISAACRAAIIRG